ncbi:MAG: cytochrome c biogenesis protein CcdA [Candidatus Acidiferrales bacterium]|jgi:cytochrome c-type biogenesis protein
MDVSIFAAFVAGLVSFLSPCVLPLVPGYVSMLSGIGVEQLKQGRAPRGSLLTSALAFVTGFSIVFITFGASASAVGSFLVRNRTLLAPLAGALILLFGLHLVGWLVRIPVRVGRGIGLLLVVAGIGLSARPGIFARVKGVDLFAIAIIFLLGPILTRWLNRDVHFRKLGGQPGPFSGFLMGFAFAFGWTPCIGPILAAVLAVAATREKIGQGVFLLACYSAGLAIPFLVTALGIGGFLRFYQNFRRHLHTVEVFSGVLLLAIGGLVFANRLTWLSNKLSFLNRSVAVMEGKLTAAPKIVPSSAKAAQPNEPDVTFQDLQGNKVPIASLKGKLVLVNFWATWCEPCRVEIPWMIEFQQKYGNRGFTLLGVAMDDEGKSVVDPFIQKTQFDVDGHPTAMDYPIVLGTDDIASKFGGLIGLPTSVLISRDGRVVKRYVGLVNQKDLEKEIQAQL